MFLAEVFSSRHRNRKERIEKNCNAFFPFSLDPPLESAVDVLWGQPIKLIQVASNSELLENQQNNLLFFEIVPCHCFRASEVQT